ncbi:MAG: type IV pilus twitching motility protein PilT [Elusimicrobiota bacterium]
MEHNVLLETMCNFMLEVDASDLHIGVGTSPYMRINGVIKQTGFPVMEQEDCERLLFSLMTESQISEFRGTKSLDFAFGFKNLGRFRANIYQQRGTITAAIRRLKLEIPTFKELSLPIGPLTNFCNTSNGLVIVAGPTGSGKSTTLAAMINFINKNRKCHIISLEDPIEYVHHNINSLVHQREIGSDAISFSSALRYVLREDPDVVLIGEMRDLETIASALTVAETGHLVLATLHTGDASESITRIVDVFSAEQQVQVIKQLSFTLAGVINQMLLPSLDENMGRVLATEVMIATPAIQNIIRENKVEHMYSQIQLGTQIGMSTMNQTLYRLIMERKIDQDIALGKTTRPNELMKMLGRK